MNLRCQQHYTYIQRLQASEQINILLSCQYLQTCHIYIISYTFKMPPKKVDAQTKEKEYAAYQATEQYQKICDLYEDITTNMVNLHGANDPFISQTSQDFDVSGKHQILWDKLYELAVLLKVKPPFKKLQHEWMRSAYFGQKNKVNKDEQVYTIDGIVCQFQPQFADAQRHIKQTLHKKITNLIRDKEEQFDIQNYNKTRAEIKKGYSQLFGILKSYIKKPFKMIYEQKFLVVLKPFSDLLEINMKLVLYQLKYQSDDDTYVNDFKKKAIVDRYCDCLEQVLHILMVHHHKPITHKIKPSNVFKKLAYRNLTKIESFYLTPFTNTFNQMKQNMCAQFTTGINFWKVPIQKNCVFVDDLKKLVDWQLVTQRHFGNSLLRDQINFVADVLLSIDKANDLSKKYMLTKDPNSIEVSIPRLIAFKTVQHMRKYKDKQHEIQMKQEQRKRIMGITAQSKQQQQQIVQQSLGGSPSGTKNTFPKVTESQVKPKPKGLKLLKKDSIEQAREQLGRYWIWDSYCDEDFKNKKIQAAVQKLRHINKAVQQDIQDFIVRQGMLPKKDRHDQQRIEAVQHLKNLKTYDNFEKAQNMKRPPQLWNFPQVLEGEHKFRSIAEPKKCYVDGRIEQFDKLIGQIGEYLRTFNKRDWNELIRRVVDFYQGNPDQSPAFLD